MTNVIPFTGLTSLDLDIDDVLEQAKGELESGIVIGYSKEDGGLEIRSSVAAAEKILWLLKSSEIRLFEVVEA